MKRRFVCIMAALLALSVCAASAELADAFPAVTVTGALTVDLNALGSAMEGAGLPSDQIERWVGLLSLLSETRDVLIIADEGFEYSATQADGETLSIAGETRDGRLNVVCSLLPNTLFTHASSGASWREIAAAAEEVTRYVNETFDAVSAAVTPGTPEMGAFEIEGERFDMRIPLDIDAAAMVRAGVALVRNLLTDETLRGAGLDALSGYADFQIDPSALPTAVAARYSADGISATLYTAELSRAGEAAATVYASVRLDGDAVRVKVSVPDIALDLTVEYAAIEDEARLRADLRLDGIDYALTVDVHTGETAVMTTALYVNDMTNALATEVNTFALTGERTMSIDPEGKLTLDIQDVSELIGQIDALY